MFSSHLILVLNLRLIIDKQFNNVTVQYAVVYDFYYNKIDRTVFLKAHRAIWLL